MRRRVKDGAAAAPALELELLAVAPLLPVVPLLLLPTLALASALASSDAACARALPASSAPDLGMRSSSPTTQALLFLAALSASTRAPLASSSTLATAARSAASPPAAAAAPRTLPAVPATQSGRCSSASTEARHRLLRSRSAASWLASYVFDSRRRATYTTVDPSPSRNRGSRLAAKRARNLTLCEAIKRGAAKTISLDFFLHSPLVHLRERESGESPPLFLPPLCSLSA